MKTLNERGKICNKKIYTPTVYVDIETGEELPKEFKKQFNYEFLEKQFNENEKTINTTRIIKIKSRKPEQLSLF